MSDDPWPTRAADEQRFADLSEALVVAVDSVIVGWVVEAVRRTATEQRGLVTPADLDAAAAAGEEARARVTAALRDALAVDLDEQVANPLHIVRAAVRYPTQVLADAGVEPPRRDPFVAERFPDDVYDLSPSTWADLHPSVHEVGMAWGAAKAFIFRARRRVEGRE